MKEAQALDVEVDLTEIELPEDPMLLIYLSASLLQISPVEKQPLLEADTAALLLSELQAAYRRELALLPGFIDGAAGNAGKSAWLN